MAVKRVLLVGPDDEARRGAHLLLARTGVEVAAIDDVAAAARYLAGTACDLVIADGQVAAALLRALPDLPVATAGKRTVQLVGQSAPMVHLRETIEKIAAHRSTVLIEGESGTGKELVARALHEQSPRHAGKFVAVNCAAIPGELLESELFGHVKGAFTGAVKDKLGLFEEANGGTLLLDEVGELPLALQAKLLRVLQEGEIRRVGDNQSIAVDVRVIAATLRDLHADVASGAFREDLYYRLAVVPLRVPPLRERTRDIAELARFFGARHATRHGVPSIELTEGAIARLADHHWPGNVRELENVIERAVVLADGTQLDAGALAFGPGGPSPAEVPTEAVPSDTEELSIKKATNALEARLIERALGITQGNRTNAAKLLEISHRALLYKMKEYGIS